MLQKIISGGQTGADRAALDAALAAGFPIGGACPVGRVAEDGPLDPVYTLDEIGGGYRQRTKRNVQDADGTAIFYSAYPRGGTEATVLFCIRQAKPYKLIDIDVVSTNVAAALLADFVREFDLAILNVAGPSASHCATIYDEVNRALGLLLHRAV
ncbi:putative molybdenum carrier protein [Halomonas sp. GD1P12]|uniref:putative molybdenum carrier protein n=1 Tax=Halomonas sp. GD1P12 TaxID=2982691 RepID=UPI0021E4CB63|nr:putative molybdenum carrier protein [Halomonas sp. GD1P12]UYF98876.1 putative molybdenum carrier protein [Halomonas sp. GD1P12]